MMQGRKGLALLPLAPAAALLVALAGAGPAHATGTTITVTGFGDGAGTCPDSTHCSTLRAAVAQANEDANNDVVSLPAGTYTLSNPEAPSIHVTEPMTIQGAGAATTTITGICTVQQQWLFRLFTVASEGPAGVAINGVTLSGGVASNPENDEGGDGGAVLVLGQAALSMSHDVVTGNRALENGGGISVSSWGASLTTTDVAVENNLAGTGASACAPVDTTTPPLNQWSNGGGVFAAGTVSMTSSSVGGNTAGGNGGGMLLSPSPETGGTDSLNLVFVHDNTAMQAAEDLDVGGGGIYGEVAPNTHVNINQSTISDNHAPHASGGGVYIAFSQPSVASHVADTTPAVTIDNTTLNGNTAAILGGGVYFYGPFTGSMTNDTVYGNSAGNGGGVAVGEAASAHLTLESITVDANSSVAIAPVTARTSLTGLGAGLFLNDGSTTIHNSVLALNMATPPPTIASVLHDCQLGRLTLTSLGYNVADDTTCNLTATGDQQPPSAVPALGPLQDNGGPTDGATGDTSPTLTQSPTTGSTLLDTGDPSNFPPTDERGVSRPQQAPSSLIGLGAPHVASRVAARVGASPRADIGALEVKAATPTPAPTPTPTPTPSSGVQGIITVPSTGGGPEPGSPAIVLLVCVSLLTAAAGGLVAWRRR